MMNKEIILELKKIKGLMGLKNNSYEFLLNEGSVLKRLGNEISDFFNTDASQKSIKQIPGFTSNKKWSFFGEEIDDATYNKIKNAIDSKDISNLNNAELKLIVNVLKKNTDFVKKAYNELIEKVFNTEEELFSNIKREVDNNVPFEDALFTLTGDVELSDIVSSTAKSNFKLWLKKFDGDNLHSDFGRKIFKPEAWDTLDISDEVINNIIKKDDNIINILKNGLKVPEQLTVDTQNLMKAYTKSSQNVELQTEIVDKISKNLQVISTNSIKEVKLIIEWLDMIIKTKKDLTLGQKKSLEELSNKLKQNNAVTGLLKFAKESVPESNAQLIWDSFTDAWDTISNFTESYGTLLRFIKSGGKSTGPGAADIGIKPLRFKFLKDDKAIQYLSSTNESWLNAWKTGNRKGWPSVDNPAWQKIIYKHGKSTAYRMYFGTLFFKWLKYSLQASVLLLAAQGASWALNADKVKKCELALREMEKTNKYSTDAVKLPDSCKTDGMISTIFFNAAWNYAHTQSGEYIATGSKAYDAFLVDGLLRNVIEPNLGNVFRVFPWSVWADTLYTIVEYSNDATYEELVQNLRKEAQTAKENAEKISKEIDEIKDLNEDQVKEKLKQTGEKIEDIVDNTKEELKDLDKQFKDKGKEYAFNIWGKTQNPPVSYKGLGEKGLVIGSDGKKYDWAGTKFYEY